MTVLAKPVQKAYTSRLCMRERRRLRDITTGYTPLLLGKQEEVDKGYERTGEPCPEGGELEPARAASPSLCMESGRKEPLLAIVESHG